MNYDYETEQWGIVDLYGRIYSIHDSKFEAENNLYRVPGCLVTKLVLRFKEGGY